jgi:hypothetical protein
MLPAVGILETKNQIKQRIIMITKYQSTNARRLMLGAASILTVSAGLLMVNAAESSSNASAPAAAAAGAPKGWGKNASDPGSNLSNHAIVSYLGDPVPPPSGLDTIYSPENLMAAFTTLMRKQGVTIQKLAVDSSEFPFLVYGVLAGNYDYHRFDDLNLVKGYVYGGSVTKYYDKGDTCFSLNMIPSDQYPHGQDAACSRRLMIRLEMLRDSSGVKSTKMEDVTSLPDAPQNLDFSSGKSSDAGLDNSKSRRTTEMTSKSEVLARVNEVAITIDQVNSVAGKRENEIRQKFTRCGQRGRALIIDIWSSGRKGTNLADGMGAPTSSLAEKDSRVPLSIGRT